MGRSGHGQGRGRDRGRGRGTGRDRRRTLRTTSLQSVLQDDVRVQGSTLESRDSEVFCDTLLFPKAPTVAIMVRFRDRDDVSALMEELHRDLKEKIIRIRKKVDPSLGFHAYRYFVMVLSI